jgi:hypothetical protein
MFTTHIIPGKRKLSNVVHYVLKPMNARHFKIETRKMLKLLLLEMKGFRYYRLWGTWKNKPKKSKRKNRKN